MTTEAEQREINLGEVSRDELIIAGYEALKMVFAASIAQLTTQDALQAKALFGKIASDIDVERARFIEVMRADAAEQAEADGLRDEDGFEYEATLVDDGEA